MYECEVLADSVGPSGKRLTTLVVTYPRFVHAELLTHRAFSRNSASSRAIPNEKLIARIRADPAQPIWWGKNQSGMQAREELSGAEIDGHRKTWFGAMEQMIFTSEMLAQGGLHKQIANRIIEPWMPITVIVSATEWGNFFKLRCHPDAQPEIRAAAEAMRAARVASTPRKLMSGEWHVPLIHAEDRKLDLNVEEIIRLSVARCARVSYLTHDGRRDPKADIELYHRLAQSGHWSPFEHVACALPAAARDGNFIGWMQHRSQVEQKDEDA